MKNSSNQKYWYFRFPEDFFEDINIRKLETMRDGFEFVVILLKLYCLAVKDGGTFQVPTNDKGDVDFNLIANIVRHTTQNVFDAIEAFVDLGLMEVVTSIEKTSFRAFQVENMTGQSSKEADVKRLQRAQLEQQKQELLPSQTEEVYRLGIYENILLTATELSKVTSEYINADNLIKRLSVKKKSDKEYNTKYQSDFEALMELLLREGIVSGSEPDEAPGVPRGVFNNVKLSAAEWDTLCKKFAEPEKLINHISKRLYEGGYKMPSHYAFAVKCGKEDGWLTVADKLLAEETAKRAKLAEDEMCKELEAEKDKEVEEFKRRKKEELGFESDEELSEYLAAQRATLTEKINKTFSNK